MKTFFRFFFSSMLIWLVASETHGQKLKPIKVCLVSGSLEYDSDASLAKLQTYLEKTFGMKCVRAFRKTDSDIPGLDHLGDCDVMVLFTRRLTPAPEQLAKIKKYCQSGKPIVGIRTASHAFQNWLELDHDILGGNYQGHYGAVTPKIKVAKGAESHFILQDVKLSKSAGSLYKNKGLAKDDDILLYGDNAQSSEPIAWTHVVNRGRVFYTSLGHQQDFEDPNFLRMIANAILWTTKRAQAAS